MPRSMLMSPKFHGRHAGWLKMYKGVTYRVSCADLGLPESQWTKQGSYQAANSWWQKKKLELDTDPEILERKRIKQEIGRAHV